jgi:hypothetical protein
MRNAYTILVRKSHGKSYLGRYRHIQGDNIKNDIEKTVCVSTRVMNSTC